MILRDPFGFKVCEVSVNGSTNLWKRRRLVHIGAYRFIITYYRFIAGYCPGMEMTRRRLLRDTPSPGVLDPSDPSGPALTLSKMHVRDPSTTRQGPVRNPSGGARTVLAQAGNARDNGGSRL